MIKKSPPCERCWPGVDSANQEAWEIYRTARMDEMGITVQSVLMLCDIFSVRDPLECIVKVQEIIGESSRIKKKRKEQKEING